MNRRQFVTGGLSLPVAATGSAAADESIPIADMHYHVFFPGVLRGRTTPVTPLRRTMDQGGIKLIAWSLVGDLPWIRSGGGRLRQSGTPTGAEALAWFKRDMARIKEHLEEQQIRIALTPADIDRALGGEPHVVLSVEGATFLDGNPNNLKLAYDMGVRHLQLVHYIRNDIGDFQTEKPEHGGLSARGREIVAACGSLGVLIDLAHATPKMVDGVLELARAPVVWSHSAIARNVEPDWTMPMPAARHIALKAAMSIAAKGGVIGLWALRGDAGSSPESYARKLAEMADQIGEDHVGIGTDGAAFSSPAIASGADMRRMVRHLSAMGLPRPRVEKLAMGNYARILKTALAPAG